MKEQIKELRVKIDGLSQLVMELIPDNNGGVSYFNHETREAYDSLILAKAWLGKILSELGAENPYGSGYKTVTDIKPTADTHKQINETHVFGKEQGIISEDYLNFNHIEKVDWLRTEIEELVVEVKNIPVGEIIRIVDINVGLTEQQKFSAFSREFAIARTNCYTHLCEARFWLGFELQRIKEEGK